MPATTEAGGLYEFLQRRVEQLNTDAVPPLRVLRREMSQQLKSLPPETVLVAARRLADHGEAGFFVAAELVYHHRPTRAAVGREELESFGRCLSSWSTVDTFAYFLSGPALLDSRIDDRVLREWSERPNRWWRRAALSSLVLVARRGNEQDAAWSLDLCERLAADRDDMVYKAVSWVLRELIGKHRNRVERFLDDHEATLAAQVKREVRNKLRTGLKSGRPRPTQAPRPAGTPTGRTEERQAVTPSLSKDQPRLGP